MQHALQWILETAPSWGFGLILVAILRWISARALGFFLIDVIDVETRFQSDAGHERRLRDAADGADQRTGCVASLVTWVPVFALGWWVTVDLWVLLQSSQNPTPALGEHGFISAIIVWFLILACTWGELGARLDIWRRDFNERTIWTLLSILALGQLVLLMVAPFGLHIYWLALRCLGYADERWLAPREAGSDIRSR